MDNFKKCRFCGYKKPNLITDEYAHIPYAKSPVKEENVCCPNCFAKAPVKVWNAPVKVPSVKKIEKVIIDYAFKMRHEELHFIDMATAIHALLVGEKGKTCL